MNPWVLKNQWGEYLVISSPLGGPRCHHRLKLARLYDTRKGALIARAIFQRRYGRLFEPVELTLSEK